VKKSFSPKIRYSCLLLSATQLYVTTTDNCIDSQNFGTCDSHTDFKVKRSKVKVTGRGHIACRTACLDMHHLVFGISFQNSFRQPHHSRLDSPPHPLLNSSLSSSTISSSITPSLLHSRLKTYLFNKFFSP